MAHIIPSNEITVHDEQLGEGSFGVVKRGTWVQDGGQQLAVAIKVLQDTSPNSAADLRNEMSHLQKLRHDSIVHLHGCVGQPPMLVFELCEGGSLLDRLKDKTKPIPLVTILHDYCIQIAKGLQFLESKHCVHRDVAARNILLAKDEKTVKIGDFGLARTLDDDEDVYVMMSFKKVPFPWCPPEALHYGEFSHASDVWAYGVTLWEIFTFGEEPWVGCRPIDVLKKIEAGERLVKPKYCSESIYQIMKDCWKSNPAERCKFGAIREDLKASKFLDAIASEQYNSIQPGTLQLVKGDEVVVVENTGQDWFGQNKKNREFGTFSRSVVFAQVATTSQPKSDIGMTSPRQASSIRNQNKSQAVAAPSAVTPQRVFPTSATKQLSGTLARSEEEKKLIAFVVEKCQTTCKPLIVKHLCQEFQQIHHSTRTISTIKSWIERFKKEVLTLADVDVNSLATLVFCLQINVSLPLQTRLKEGGSTLLEGPVKLRKLKAYVASDGSLKFEGQHQKREPGQKGTKKVNDEETDEETGEESEDESEDDKGTTPAQSVDVEIGKKNDSTMFVTKSDAVLWEDDNIRIGCKLETHNNLGRLDMFYGNKTSQPFNKFTPIITCPGALAAQLQAQAKPVGQIIAAGTRVQQLINFVCVQEFQKMPIMNIKFTFTDRAGALQNFDKNFNLPLFISTFFEPINMTSEQFSTRWKSLRSASQKAQKTFKAQSMDSANIETKLKGFGANLLTDVDPNPKIYMCAGVIHTQTGPISTLIHLNPNMRKKTYCLTIRSSKDTVAQTLVDLLANQF